MRERNQPEAGRAGQGSACAHAHGMCSRRTQVALTRCLGGWPRSTAMTNAITRAIRRGPETPALGSCEQLAEIAERDGKETASLSGFVYPSTSSPAGTPVYSIPAVLGLSRPCSWCCCTAVLHRPGTVTCCNASPNLAIAYVVGLLVSWMAVSACWFVGLLGLLRGMCASLQIPLVTVRTVKSRIRS